jgi:hypothetical protein
VKEAIPLVGIGRQENNMWLPSGGTLTRKKHMPPKKEVLQRTTPEKQGRKEAGFKTTASFS